MSIPTTVRGKIDPTGILKADRFFAGNLKTVFTELVQNSRRAHAKRIDVSVREVQVSPSEYTAIVTFVDDGVGVENPQVLFDLLKSQWDPQTTSDEDPAGAGFFALAAAADSVEIASHNWRVCADRDVFVGKKDAVVVPLESAQKGLALKFNINSKNQHEVSSRGIHDVLISVAQYGSVRVFFNGHEIPLLDWLCKCFAVVERDGVRVGFYFDGLLPKNLASRYQTFSRNFKDAPRVNFYGVTLHTSEIAATENTIGPEGNVRVHALVDIIDTRAIKMTLPQRDAIIENASWKDLCQWARLEAYRQGLKVFENRHRLSFSVYKELRAAGVDLPEALPVLKLLYVSPADAYFERKYPNVFERHGGEHNYRVRRLNVCASRPGQRLFVLGENSDIDKGVLISVFAALLANRGSKYDPAAAFRSASVTGDENIVLLEGQPRYLGYTWYNNLETLEYAHFELRNHHGDKHTQLYNFESEHFAGSEDHSWPADIKTPKQLCRSIHMSLGYVAVDGTKHTLPPMQAPVFLCGTDDGPAEMRVFLTRELPQLMQQDDNSAGLPKLDIIYTITEWMMLAAYLQPEYCGDNSASEDDASDAAYEVVQRQLRGPLQNVLAALREKFRDYAEFDEWENAGIKGVSLTFTLDAVKGKAALACVDAQLTITDTDGVTVHDAPMMEAQYRNEQPGKKKAGKKKTTKVS